MGVWGRKRGCAGADESSISWKSDGNLRDAVSLRKSQDGIRTHATDSLLFVSFLSPLVVPSIGNPILATTLDRIRHDERISS